MKLLRMLSVSLVALLTAPLVQAESRWFVAPMYGASFGGDLEVTSKLPDQERTDVGDLEIDDDSHVGLMIGMETPDPGNVYLLYSTQSTRFKEGSIAPSNGVDVDVSYYHFGGSLYFPRGDLEPYLSASIGATHLKPSGNYSDELAFSLGLALGARYMPLENLGLYAELRGFYTGYDSSTKLVCPDSDGNCTLRIESNGFFQGQASIGVVVRF